MENRREPEFAALVMIYLAAVTFGNLLILAIGKSHGEPSLLLISASAGFIASEMSLIAVWIAFSTLALPWRVLAALPGGAVVFFTMLTSMTRGEDVPLALAVGALGTLVSAGPILIVRSTGLRLALLPPDVDAQSWRPEGNPRQFTLRQMFAWTLATAMVAALIRFIATASEFKMGRVDVEGFVTLIIVGVVVGIIAAGMVWAALGRGIVPLRLFIVTGLVVLAGLIFSAVLRAPDEAILGLFIMSIADCLFTFGGLVVLRPIGVRLVRPRQLTSPVSNEHPLA